MRQIICSYIIVALFFACTSCSTKQYQVLFQQKNAVSDSSYHSVDSSAEYRIKAQDVLQIRNLQDGNAMMSAADKAAVKNTLLTATNEGSLTFQVDDDGTVILPVIGRIKVAGYTRLEAQKIVEDAYKKDVLVNPIIELKIVSLKVIIFGEMKGQGSFLLTKEHTSLVEMIGAAGGLTNNADETNIKIIRGTKKNPKVTTVDLSDIQSINDPKAILQNGDIIYVSQNKRAARSENFQNFSGSIFQPILLLFNTALIIFTFIHR